MHAEADSRFRAAVAGAGVPGTQSPLCAPTTIGFDGAGDDVEGGFDILETVEDVATSDDVVVVVTETGGKGDNGIEEDDEQVKCSPVAEDAEDAQLCDSDSEKKLLFFACSKHVRNLLTTSLTFR